MDHCLRSKASLIGASINRNHITLSREAAKGLVAVKERDASSLRFSARQKRRKS